MKNNEKLDEKLKHLSVLVFLDRNMISDLPFHLIFHCLTVVNVIL